MYGSLLGGYEFEVVVGLHKMQDQKKKFVWFYLQNKKNCMILCGAQKNELM